jgi:hypothetical protein
MPPKLTDGVKIHPGVPSSVGLDWALTRADTAIDALNSSAARFLRATRMVSDLIG